MKITVFNQKKKLLGITIVFYTGLQIAGSITLANPTILYQIPDELLVDSPKPSGSPDRTTTVDGGSRGPCEQEALNLFAALIPSQALNNDESQRWTLTSQDHPTIWFYLPTAYYIERAKFSLRSQGGTEILYETELTTLQPGIVAIPIPDTVPPLATGKVYETHLYLDVYPTDQSPLAKCEALGFMKKSDLPLMTPQPEINYEEKAAIYAQKGFWLDALNELGIAACQGQPPTPWQVFLSTIHYPNFIPFAQPIVEAPFTACPIANSPPE